jgi:hypothetical protein
MEHLEGLGLLEGAREGLGVVGVPNEVEVLFTVAALEERELKGVGTAIRFGHAWHDEYDLCVALPDGRVFASHRFRREVTFVNTNVLLYLEFLLRVARMYRMFDAATEGAMSESSYLDEASETQHAAQRLDPDAMLDGAWWSGVIEELKLI